MKISEYVRDTFNLHIDQRIADATQPPHSIRNIPTEHHANAHRWAIAGGDELAKELLATVERFLHADLSQSLKCSLFVETLSFSRHLGHSHVSNLSCGTSTLLTLHFVPNDSVRLQITDRILDHLILVEQSSQHTYIETIITNVLPSLSALFSDSTARNSRGRNILRLLTAVTPLTKDVRGELISSLIECYIHHIETHLDEARTHIRRVSDLTRYLTHIESRPQRERIRNRIVTLAPKLRPHGELNNTG